MERNKKESPAQPEWNKRWSESYPDLGTEPLSIEPYISDEYFEDEKEHVFSNVWIHVGRVEEIPAPGDFFVRDLDVPNVSVLIVRGKDGVLRGFHNVCAHRCNKLVNKPHGNNAGRFSCKFHGWTYSLDGRLIGLPDREQFHGIVDSEYGLTPISMDIWEGFIFINASPEPKETLQEFMGKIGEGLVGYPFGEMECCFAWRAEVNCNWKLAIDGFQEAYHVAFTHNLSVSDKLSSAGNRLNHPLAVVLDKYHRKLSLGANRSTVYGNPLAAIGADQSTVVKAKKPIEEAAFRFGSASLKNMAEKFKLDSLPAGMNPANADNWLFDINAMFPEFYLSMRPNYYHAYNFRPVSANKTIFEARSYFPKATKASGRFYQEYMKCVLRDVVLEDWGMAEQVQCGLSTRAKTHMVLQEHEICVRHLNKVTDRYIQSNRGSLNQTKENA